MSDLKPCPYRHVGDEGHILCDRIKTGDREVTPDICRACPISHINCAHLRATLNHQAHPPLTVRYGNGRIEVWEEDTPRIAFKHAACAAKVITIRSEQDCAGCAIHQALVATDSVPQPKTTTSESIQAQGVVETTLAGRSTPPSPQVPIVDERSSIVAKKIIQLQEWLAKQKKISQTETPRVIDPREDPSPRARAAGEEKRVGWTD